MRYTVKHRAAMVAESWRDIRENIPFVRYVHRLGTRTMPKGSRATFIVLRPRSFMRAYNIYLYMYVYIYIFVCMYELNE